jgi:hypothetical protein
VAAENHPRNDDYAKTFQEKTVPTGTRLAGWAALVQTFGVQAPVRRPSTVSGQHVKASRRGEGGWNVFDKRYWPGESFGDQLEFALPKAAFASTQGGTDYRSRLRNRRSGRIWEGCGSLGTIHMACLSRSTITCARVAFYVNAPGSLKSQFFVPELETTLVDTNSVD